MKNSPKIKAKALSFGVENFNTVVCLEPQMQILYQVQQSQPNVLQQTPPLQPPVVQLQWSFLLLVNFFIVWRIKK